MTPCYCGLMQGSCSCADIRRPPPGPGAVIPSKPPKRTEQEKPHDNDR